MCLCLCLFLCWPLKLNLFHFKADQVVSRVQVCPACLPAWLPACLAARLILICSFNNVLLFPLQCKGEEWWREQADHLIWPGSSSMAWKNKTKGGRKEKKEQKEDAFTQQKQQEAVIWEVCLWMQNILFNEISGSCVILTSADSILINKLFHMVPVSNVIIIGFLIFFNLKFFLNLLLLFFLFFLFSVFHCKVVCEISVEERKEKVMDYCPLTY